MPTATATLVYTVTTTAPGISSGFLGAQMGKCPLPQRLLDRIGALVISDTVAGPTRTIVLGLVPTAAATATAARFPGDPTGSPIDTLTLTAPGSGYAAPPDVVITDLPPASPPMTGGGFAPRSYGVGAKANAQLDVGSLVLGLGGGYTSAPTVTIVGGFGPKGGVAATATATFGGGTVTGLTLVTHGSGYVSVPTVVFSGGGGTGATATAVLELSGLTLLNPGKYYINPQVELRSHFKMLFPDAGDQRAPFWNLIKTQIERYIASPVFAADPVIA